MRCQCIKKDLKQCNYPSKPDSQFCGVHKKCKTIMEPTIPSVAADSIRPKPKPKPKARARSEPKPEIELRPEQPKPNAFDVLPKQLVEHVLSFANAQDLHQIKKVDRRLWHEVQDKYRSDLRKARKLLGVHAEPFTDAQLMARVKYLSDGQYDATGIKIIDSQLRHMFYYLEPSSDVSDVGRRWEKGSRSVTVNYNNNGKVIDEAWTIDNYYLRLDGPAHLAWYDNGRIKHERWFTDVNTLCRLDGPAKIVWYANGQKMQETWYTQKHPDYRNNKHRLDGPAYTMWDEHGHKEIEEWYNNDKLHRSDGPAIYWYPQSAENDVISLEEWYINGVLTRRYRNGQDVME
jgi:hypothetical protein